MHIEGDLDSVPDFVGTRDRVIEELVRFTRTLRSVGVATPANAAVLAARALAVIGFDDRERARIALRSALISRQEDIDPFERLFPAFWRRLNSGPSADDGGYAQGADAPLGPVPSIDLEQAAEPPEMTNTEDDSGERERQAITSRLSLSDEPTREFETDEPGETAAVYSPTGSPELVAGSQPTLDSIDATLERGLARLTTTLAELKGRRWTRPGSDRIDTRRALRQSFETGGTVLSVPERERQRSAVKAVLFVDVSQSVLDTIDRDFLIRFLRGVTTAWRSVRLFFFDTSIREVSEPFDADSPQQALDALEQAEAEWGGGTRIGHAIDTIRNEQPDLIDRNTVVFMISDGLEVGEIDLLEDGMAWLSRRAAAILWLNPLANSPAYEPTCRGMAASLPYIDGLFAFSAPADVEEIVRQLERQGLHGRLGYEYDPGRRDQHGLS